MAAGFAGVARGKGSTISNVVASVDSVVIQRKCPIASQEKNVAGHFCRKGYFATTMLAFVDAFGRFLSISIVCASSSHDSTAFSCSRLGQQIVNGGLGKKWSIVGDDAFTCAGNIITPFSRHGLNMRQRNYNYFCSLLRQAVECAFGRWKAKWGILWRPLLVNADNIKGVLECTCRLHNFCIDQGCDVDARFLPPMEDLWWIRTGSPKVMATGKAPLPPIAIMEPYFACAATVRTIIGVSGPKHNNRDRAVDEVEKSGLVAPDRSGKWARAADHKKRVSGNIAGLNAWRIRDTNL